ncbi:tRNA pseudouridine synthase A [Mongoliibacter ruber]|uniref:tRNA pseudouridine synthase A n=1 Tax=Mongoliibacter ruber TaxID=1750599 RepID=A0A2T0WQH8_9BACT|nr:tRNA pseudouridine(38-40) synthase TruA [Mongoliibacter ruber]PRY88958.1 tRNA pseudouridine38-40 synthase [Mongoliibacter ruber]
MQNKPFTFLFYIQYLGLRYAGWQKQKGVKTIQGTLERAFRYVLGHEDFTILGASRTDAGVSCENGAFELFLRADLVQEDIVSQVNLNLPSDIRLLDFKRVSLDFNVIQDVAWKSYAYNFIFGEKPNPLLNPTSAFFAGIPDVELMQEAVTLFEGKKDFKRFCAIDKVTDNYVREVLETKISLVSSGGLELQNQVKIVFEVKGAGFLRYQVRIMAGALADLGLGRLSFSAFKEALDLPEGKPIAIAAPACGLVLAKIQFSSK